MPEIVNPISTRGSQLDWSQLTGSLSNAILDWDKSIKGKRAEDEAMLQQTGQNLNATEQPKTQSLNEFILSGTNEGRDKIYQWNQDLKAGKINRAEYHKRMTNLNDYWGNLATVTKTLDTRIQQAMERQQVGEDGTLPPASAIEVEMQGYFGGLANLKDKKLNIGDDGRVLLATMNPDGVPTSLESIKYMNNPLNIAFNRTDVSGMVKAEVENWGKWDIGLTADQRNNPNFKKSKAQLIDAITGSPRSAASVLVDNTDEDYTVFFNEKDKMEKFAQLKKLNEEADMGLTDEQISEKLIQMRQDENGDYQPVLSEKQQQKAKEVVAREIEMQVSRTVDLAPRYSGGGSDKGDDVNVNELVGGYKATLRAFGFDPDAVKSNINDHSKWGRNPNNVNFGGLSNQFKYVYKNGKVEVYDKESNVLGGGIQTGKENLLFVAKEPMDLAQYIYGHRDASQNTTSWQDGRKYFLGDAVNQQQTKPVQSKNKPAPPKKGAIVNGYKFLGGDPSSQKNWVKAK